MQDSDAGHVPGRKESLRAESAAARRARSSDELDAARAAVRQHVLARCDADGWRCVAAYVALRAEPGSVDLLAGLTSRGVRVLVPLMLPDRDLDWAEWAPDGLGAALGPDAIGLADAVLVPASKVAADGTRLGRGGGSYDRALPRTAPGTPRIALIFDDELVPSLPREAWDAEVTDVVQPAGWTRLGAAD